MRSDEAAKIIEKEKRCVLTDCERPECKNCVLVMDTGEILEALDMAISALEKQEVNRWRPCNEKPEYDFRNVLVRWRDKRKGCEKDYYIFEGYVVRGIWCGLFEDADISDFEPIEWKPLEPYTEKES